MQIALRYGKGNPPLWATVLAMASDWGVAPWEIMERPNGALWLKRWQAMQEAKALNAKMTEGKKHGNR